MSGYLPPHTKDGPHSKTYKPDYPLVSAAYDAPSSEYPVSLPSNVTPTVHTLIVLGPEDKPTGLKVPVLGFGLWGWGDVLTYGWAPSGGYDLNLNDDSIATAFDAMFRHFPKVLVDTAEHYGYTDGLSETNLGKLYEQKMKDHRERIVLATKYLPTPWRHPWRYPDIVIESMGGSLSRTKLGHIDIYQLHAPSHLGIWPRLETICIALAEAYKTGYIKAIGVCNLSVDQTKYVYEELKKRDVPLVSNQVEFSLLRTEPWKNGLIDWGRQNGVSISSSQRPIDQNVCRIV
jgi:aryl-alcohol dehydrogenase-like predicted oxidoreductase